MYTIYIFKYIHLHIYIYAYYIHLYTRDPVRAPAIFKAAAFGDLDVRLIVARTKKDVNLGFRV